jgi:hypothetical protein
VANECTPLFRPGGDITCLTTGAVTGCTFVDISATRDATTGLIKVATASAAAKAFGVASKDAASGARVVVINGPGQIVPVVARATIAFGVEVEVGGTGGVITLASGKAVGKAVEAGTNGNNILIELY